MIVEAHIIDKGIPTTCLLAQVLVAKFSDHLPLYRLEAIFGRADVAIPRSTLGDWVGSCGVQLQQLVDALKAEGQCLEQGPHHVAQFICATWGSCSGEIAMKHQCISCE